MAGDTTRRDKGNSFLRVFRILEAVVDADHPLTTVEISKAVGLPGATTHRLCKMLLEERLLQYEIDGKQLLVGPRLLEFAGGALSGSHHDLDRRVILETLVEEIGETCNISIPDGTRMIYAERVEAHWPLRMQLPAGTPVPLHCTAGGKLYLSQLSPAGRRRLLERLPVSKQTPYTITAIDALELEIQKIQEQGFSSDNEEFIEGLVAVAVPIRDPKGRFCAALALHAPKLRMTMADALGQLPTLRAAADRIESLMVDSGS